MQAAGIGVLGGHVALLLRVNEVERRHGFHTQLGGVVTGKVLGLVWTVEVVATDRRLAARHVAADDEMGTAVVLADDHVLQRLAGASHVHRVGQVGPANAGVVHLGGQALIGLEAHLTRNVVVLGGAAGGMNQHHALIAHVGGIKRTGEQLVVGAVDGVAALERNHVLALGQVGAHFSRRFAGEDALRKLQALDGTAEVVTTTLGGDHLHGGMLERGGAVATHRLARFIGLPLALHGHHRQLLAAVGEQQLLAHRDVVALGVHHDRQAE